MSTFLPSSKLLRSTLTSSRKTQIKYLFIKISTAGKKTETTTSNPSLKTDTVLGGPYEPEALRRVTGPTRDQPPYSDTPSRLMFPVDCRMVLMILRAVSNRIGSDLHGTEGLVDFSTATPSGRESKTSTERSARNSPPSLGMKNCLLRSFRFQNGCFVNSF